MFGNFTEEARNIIVVAKEEMTKLKHPYVGSEHLLLAILKTNNEEVSINWNQIKNLGSDVILVSRNL